MASVVTSYLDAFAEFQERFDCPEKFEGHSWCDLYDQLDASGIRFWEVAADFCSDRELTEICRSMLGANQKSTVVICPIQRSAK